MIQRSSLVRQLPAFISLTVCASAQAGYSVNGSTQSVAGTNGNPILQTPTVTIDGPGTFTTGPLTGPNGNTSSTSVVVELANPLPSITAFATGADPAGSTSTHGFAIVDIFYHFYIDGPASPGMRVPLIFAGSTSGSIVQSGDPSQYASFTGTDVDIQAIGLNDTFHDVGTTGTLPTVLPFGANNPNGEHLGWGHSAAEPVGYTDYASSFAYEANVLVGDIATVTLSAYLLGGVGGVLHPTGVPASGTARAFVDPMIYVDPAFLALHPGYTVVVDDGIGNVTPITTSVPEPETWALLVAGLGLFPAGMRRALARR